MNRWFGPYIAGAERVSVEDLGNLSAARDSGVLSSTEVERLRYADLLVRGRSRNDGSDEVILAVEISQTINLEDIERAQEHALTLRRAGYNARALVGCNRVAEGLDERAVQLGVLVDLHRAAA